MPAKIEVKPKKRVTLEKWKEKSFHIGRLGYSLCRKLGALNYEEITPTFSCKTHLEDVYSANKENVTCPIPGSLFGETVNPDWSGLCLALYFPNDKSREMFKKNISFIHKIEEQNKIPKFRVYKLDDGLLIQANKKWLTNTLYMSLYTLLLRVATYDIDPENWRQSVSKLTFNNDASYILSIPESTWNKVLDNLDVMKTDFWAGLSLAEDGYTNFHCFTGFLSVFGNCGDSFSRKVMMAKNKHYQVLIKEGVLESYTKFNEHFYT